MPLIHFTDVDGDERDVEGLEGSSVMHTAVNNDVAGIEGECGGEMNCGTCHVYVDAAWTDKLADVSREEDDMLDVVNDRRPTSRLSCQIRLSSDLDGLPVTVADP